ncbi:Domain of uncharacterised function (DUF2825) [Corynebacterium diphtheriae]|nr:Domain of uncharacterised function (DUF2825) [Corynebacterium diphtheriae]
MLSPVLLEKGSSPLVRGKRAGDHWAKVGPGLIPAGAGKTCGVVHIVFLPWGSSPLVRGKRAGDHWAKVGPGLIPAGAGKTTVCPWNGIDTRAHPRWCGENIVLEGVGVVD